MAQLLEAYTSCALVYPPYVNASLDDAGVSLTVRGDPNGERCGETVTMHLSIIEFREWLSKTTRALDREIARVTSNA